MIFGTAKIDSKKESTIFGVIKNQKIFDIFSKKEKKSKKETRPKIIIDIHEKNSLVLSGLTSEAEVELKSLEIGDYLVGETVIERKTFRDFISSMISKRLIEQLAQMQKYESRILILEGKDFEELKDTKINPNAIRGMILSISLDFKTPIIFTKDSEDTSKFILVLAKRQLKNPQEISFHSRKPATQKEQKQYIIESFPNIGPKNAKVLLKKFGSIKKIINASQEDLEKLIGKKAESFGLVDS
jgi:ERCC4-type nuclease